MVIFSQIPVGDLFVAGWEEDGEFAAAKVFRKNSATTGLRRFPLYRKDSSGREIFDGFAFVSPKQSTRFRSDHPVTEYAG